MEVKVVTFQTDGDAYVFGVYLNLTDSEIWEVLNKELTDVSGYEIHNETINTKVEV